MPEPINERKALRAAIGGVLFNASNFPEKAQVRILGQDMGPLTDKITDAVLAARSPDSRCADRTRAPRGILRCLLPAGHEIDPLSSHRVDPGGDVE